MRHTVVLVLGLVLVALVMACGDPATTTTVVSIPEPTPDIEATVEARVDEIVSARIATAIATLTSPTSLAVPTPLPTAPPSPIPSATPTASPMFSAAEVVAAAKLWIREDDFRQLYREMYIREACGYKDSDQGQYGDSYREALLDNADDDLIEINRHTYLEWESVWLPERNGWSVSFCVPQFASDYLSEVEQAERTGLVVPTLPMVPGVFSDLTIPGIDLQVVQTFRKESFSGASNEERLVRYLRALSAQRDSLGNNEILMKMAFDYGIGFDEVKRRFNASIEEIELVPAVQVVQSAERRYVGALRAVGLTFFEGLRVFEFDGIGRMPGWGPTVGVLAITPGERRALEHPSSTEPCSQRAALLASLRSERGTGKRGDYLR